MRNAIAKIMTWAWPVLAIGYIIGSTHFFVEWLGTIDRIEDKLEMAAAMPVFIGMILFLFVIHHFYGKLVRLIRT